MSSGVGGQLDLLPGVRPSRRGRTLDGGRRHLLRKPVISRLVGLASSRMRERESASLPLLCEVAEMIKMSRQ